MDKSEQITIQALLDSGGSKSLIKRRVAQRMGLTYSKSTPTRWTTPAGELVTDATVKVPLIFPMLNRETVIHWSFHVTPDTGAYEMIIGRDLLMSCKIDIRFSDNSITMGSARVPFQTLKSVDPRESTNEPTVIPSMTRARCRAATASSACQVHGRRLLCTKTWNQRMSSWLHAEYKRVFDSSIERWVVNDQKLLTIEGIHSHETELHQPSSTFLESMRMEFKRLSELQVFKPMARPPWHVQRYETSRRMIYDSQHQRTANTPSYNMATHVDISHLAKMRMSLQQELQNGYNFLPQTLHCKV